MINTLSPLVFATTSGATSDSKGIMETFGFQWTLGVRTTMGWWRPMASEAVVNIGSGNGLMPDSTKLFS